MQHRIEPAALTEAQETTLYEAYLDVAAGLDANSNVDAFLSAFEPIVPSIVAFFDTVMVNADDEKLRSNRLGLMQAISKLQKGRADLSELVGF